MSIVERIQNVQLEQDVLQSNLLSGNLVIDKPRGYQGASITDAPIGLYGSIRENNSVLQNNGVSDKVFYKRASIYMV